MTLVSDPTVVANNVRLLNTGERYGYDTRQHLQNATEQARKRGFDKVLIVDTDAHHVGELASFRDMIKYLEDPFMRYEALHGEHLQLAIPTFRTPPRQSIAGRLTRYM